MPTKIQKREIEFVARTVTRIWEELPASDNPYLAEKYRCHGYDLVELVKKRSFIDVLYLLFQGELPSKEQSELLETLMTAFINPGPRHPATRAAMNAGVGKTYPPHILPIGLSVLGGAHLGGEEVSASMQFLRKNRKKEPENLAEELLANSAAPEEGDHHIAPGFGSRFGGIDPLPREIAKLLYVLPGSGEALGWGEKFAEALKPNTMGWLATGVAAAVFCDLGFHPRVGAGLFQLICAPGLLAHGLELANKPITAMPFLDEEHYLIEKEEEKGKRRND